MPEQPCRPLPCSFSRSSGLSPSAYVEMCPNLGGSVLLHTEPRNSLLPSDPDTKSCLKKCRSEGRPHVPHGPADPDRLVGQRIQEPTLAMGTRRERQSCRWILCDFSYQSRSACAASSSLEASSHPQGAARSHWVLAWFNAERERGQETDHGTHYPHRQGPCQGSGLHAGDWSRLER